MPDQDRSDARLGQVVTPGPSEEDVRSRVEVAANGYLLDVVENIYKPALLGVCEPLPREHGLEVTVQYPLGLVDGAGGSVLSRHMP